MIAQLKRFFYHEVKVKRAKFQFKVDVKFERIMSSMLRVQAVLDRNLRCFSYLDQKV